MSVQEKKNHDFYNKQLNAIKKLNNNKVDETNFTFMTSGSYNEIFTNDKFVVIRPLIKQSGTELQPLIKQSGTERNNFNKAFANALLSAGGRNTLKYGITNNKNIFTKLKSGNVMQAYDDDKKKYKDIYTALKYGNSLAIRPNLQDSNITDNSQLLYPLPQLLLLGMIDRKPENTVYQISKSGQVKYYEIDHDNIFLDDNILLVDNSLSERKYSHKFDYDDVYGFPHLFNKSEFFRKYMSKYLRLLSDQNEKDSNFKNKIADCIENFTLTSEKLRYVLKYTTMQAHYLGLDEKK